MKLNDIVARINLLLAGERHTYLQLVDHLDSVIDDINSQLDSKFPAFSELEAGDVEYTAIPDRYIRSVICTGAAWYYFTTDEEGEVVAQQYMYNYERNLYMMIRDYITLVPLEYRNDVYLDEETGEYLYGPDRTLTLNEDLESGKRGVVVDASNIIP